MVVIKKIYHLPYNSYCFQYYCINKSRSADYYSWALLPYNDNLKCVCRIVPVSDLNPSFYSVQTDVLHYSDFSQLYSHLDVDPFEYINTEEIKILSLVNINNVDVTIIFENITDSFMWKNNFIYLQTIVRNILIMFTVVNNSVVSVSNIKEIPTIGIHFIVVHNTGSKKCACNITSKTNVTIRNVISLITFKKNCSSPKKNKMVALESQRNFLQKMLKVHANKLLKRHRLCNKVLLIGPSGSGKTLLIKSLVNDMKLLLLVVDSAQLAANSVHGKSKETLQSYFHQANLLSKEDENGLCVILLKNIDYICPKEATKTQITARKILHQFKDILDNDFNYGNLFVIATTNKIHLIDSTVRTAGRLETEIYIGVLSENDRYNALTYFCKDTGLNTSVCKTIASRTPGYILSDLEWIVHAVAKHKLNKNTDDTNEDTDDLLSKFNDYLQKYRPSGLRSNFTVNYGRRSLSMDNIGGMKSIKLALKSFVEWPLKYAKKFHQFGIPIPKGILLYGPPGCAKTSLVCALANSLNTTFLSVSAAELYSPYVGVTERNVTELFDRARTNSPCILFIDEIDALVGKRENIGKDIRQNVLSSFLIELDGVGTKVDITHTRDVFDAHDNSVQSKAKIPAFTVMVIAATNRLDKLDSAILRPGRFDKILYVGLPNYEDRLEILHTVIRNWNMPLSSSVNLDYIAERTENYSGADLTDLVREAGFAALTKSGVDVESVTQEHFLTALASVKLSTTAKQREFYEMQLKYNY